MIPKLNAQEDFIAALPKRLPAQLERIAAIK
jgi:hypothetical protein